MIWNEKPCDFGSRNKLISDLLSLPSTQRTRAPTAPQLCVLIVSVSMYHPEADLTQTYNPVLEIGVFRKLDQVLDTNGRRKGDQLEGVVLDRGRREHRNGRSGDSFETSLSACAL